MFLEKETTDFIGNHSENGLTEQQLQGLLADIATDRQRTYQQLFNGTLDSALFRIYRQMSVESWYGIDASRKHLDDSSILLTMNHSHMHDTFVGLLTSLFLIDPEQKAARALLVNHKLVGDSSHHPYKLPTLTILSLGKVHPIPVLLKKYEWQSDERQRRNLQAKQDTVSRLSLPNSIVAIYPEGEMQPVLSEAKRGLGDFISTGYGHTVPVTTNIVHWARSMFNQAVCPLTVSQPIENRGLIDTAYQINSDNPGRLASDFVMTKIAEHLPPDQMGFYGPFLGVNNNAYSEDIHIRALQVQELSEQLPHNR